MLTKGITDKRDIPHEPGEWIEIRKLSWIDLDDAREARQAAVFGNVKAMGGEVMAALPKRCKKGCGEEKHDGACPPPEERADDSAADPTNEYDQNIMLHRGIVAWSYEEPSSGANIDTLDEVTAHWIHGELVVYNTVPKGDEQKN